MGTWPCITAGATRSMRPKSRKAIPGCGGSMRIWGLGFPWLTKEVKDLVFIWPMLKELLELDMALLGLSKPAVHLSKASPGQRLFSRIQKAGTCKYGA